MYFEKETKEQFVKMLNEKHIIVIECRKPGRNTYSYKFIGASNEGKWDFTPLMAEYSGYRSNRKKWNIEYISVYANDGAAVICATLEAFAKEGINVSVGKGYSQYAKVRDLLTVIKMSV